MAIEFPNQSRSYDPSHRRVRFWGHDDSREVSFLVEAEALRSIDAQAGDEEALLETFDANWERIQAAARKAYSRRGNGFYVLAAPDI
jgi:ribosomal protein L28